MTGLCTTAKRQFAERLIQLAGSGVFVVGRLRASYKMLQDGNRDKHAEYNRRIVQHLAWHPRRCFKSRFGDAAGIGKHQTQCFQTKNETMSIRDERGQ